MPEIFFLGLMGTGKSYWAQRISAIYKTDWADLDAEIEKETMLSINEIFEIEGEEYFRKQETIVLKKLTAFKNLIIATGGGTPCFNENMQWMNSNGITIWIDEPIEVLAGRLEKEKAYRPLIKNLSDEELHDFLSGKLKERIPYYSQAQHHLQGKQISDDGFALIIKNYV